jgi:hypothetical protein
MTIEIICDGCIDCAAIKGMVCQAVADLNLDAEVLSNHDPRKHKGRRNCDGTMKMRIDDIVVSARSDCSVRDLMLLFNKEPIRRDLI